MIYRILFFLFVVGTLQAKEDRLAPEAEPLALVHGCVNVVTGEFIQQETDLFIGGPSALLHSRIYDSGNSNVQSTMGSGFTWSIPRQIRFFTTYNKRTKDYEDNLVDGGTTIITMEEREGVSLVYQGHPKYETREFFEYDKFANQIRHILDDGSGSDPNDLTDVSVRTIHEIDPITTPLSPAFGKPRTRYEKYVESGQEIPLRTIRYEYNSHARYETTHRYDPSNRKIATVGPYGNETHYRYDGAGRLIETSKGTQRTTLSYDSLGRKHRSLEWIDPTHARATIWEYDQLSRITEERIEDHTLTHSYGLRRAMTIRSSKPTSYTSLQIPIIIRRINLGVCLR